MITRLIVITPNDSFEMWGQSFEEAAQRFSEAHPDVPHRIFLTGEVPTWVRLDGWNSLLAGIKSEHIAKRLLWIIDDLCS